jgi:F-type H+-transporting ATPase subunit alpha
MPVEEQVVGIFAGTNGYLDEIPLEDVQRFEGELREYVNLKYQDVFTTIAEQKTLSEQMTGKLHAILKEFSSRFKVSMRAS